MQTLYVLYDGQCALCRRVRGWLARQPAFVPLSFLALQSPEAGCRFPGLEEFRPGEELVVISDGGELWRGGRAWIMCLWALREYRHWAVRLAEPALLPFARRACLLISENRQMLSRWFGSERRGELETQLKALPEPCDRTGYCRPV